LADLIAWQQFHHRNGVTRHHFSPLSCPVKLLQCKIAVVFIPDLVTKTQAEISGVPYCM